MAFYTFRNKKTGKEFDKELPMDEREKFLEDNPDLEQVLKKLNTVHSMDNMLSHRKDGGFREVLERIHHDNPGSVLDKNSSLLKNKGQI